MKIAGLTWWRGNYGSILQAYALQTVMSGFSDIDYEILDQFGEFGSAESLFEKIKVIGLKNTWKKVRWKFLSKSLRSRNTAYMTFIKEHLKVSEIRYTSETIRDSLKEYDGYICGSDQIWNPVLSSLEDIYWLGFVPSDRLKIAYAPSIGIKEADKDTRNKIKKNLESFDAISCRENVGTKLINSILNADLCKNVIDPTLLLTCDEWNKILPTSSKAKSSRYVFTYILRGDKEQRKLVEIFARSKGLKIVTFPYLDSDCIEKYDKYFGDEQIYDASPADFIQLIKGADFVFTDSFHCTVFSILYHKMFYLFPKIGKTQNTRLYDLQEKFNIADRLITEYTIERISELGDIDWANVERQLQSWRSESLRFLTGALGKNND